MTPIMSCLVASPLVPMRMERIAQRSGMRRAAARVRYALRACSVRGFQRSAIPNGPTDLHARMVGPFGVTLELIGPEVNRAEIAGGVAFGFVVEVP